MLSSLIAGLLSFIATFFSKVTVDYLAQKKADAEKSKVREKEASYVDIANQGADRKSTVKSLRDHEF